MFSLLFIDSSGQRTKPETPCEANHASTARTYARNLAQLSGRSVAVCREFGSRIAFIVEPDGAILPPPGVKVAEREQCTKGAGTACFCSPCRADRREARDAACA